MDSWLIDYLAEWHRQRILEEVEQICLEKLARQSRRSYRQPFFERALFKFGNWMISTGKQLHNRFEVPGTDNKNSPVGGT